MELEERFWSKVNILGEDDCWEWNAAIDTSGYGAFKYNRKKYDSNRMTWFIVYGEFPELWVLHKCDNRLCCNPNHLFLGTYQDNIDDMVKKGRTATGIRSGSHTHPERRARGEKHGRSKLKEKDVLEIRSKYAEGKYTFRDLEKIFGIHNSHIGKIIKLEKWNHI